MCVCSKCLSSNQYPSFHKSVLNTRLPLQFPTVLSTLSIVSPLLNMTRDEKKLRFLLHSIPGDLGGNAHRGTRWHWMQSFGGSFTVKYLLVTWAGTGLLEGCNWRKLLSSCYLFIEMKYTLVKFLEYVIESNLVDIVKTENRRISS